MDIKTRPEPWPRTSHGLDIALEEPLINRPAVGASACCLPRFFVLCSIHLHFHFRAEYAYFPSSEPDFD